MVEPGGRCSRDPRADLLPPAPRARDVLGPFVLGLFGDISWDRCFLSLCTGLILPRGSPQPAACRQGKMSPGALLALIEVWEEVKPPGWGLVVLPTLVLGAGSSTWAAPSLPT